MFWRLLTRFSAVLFLLGAIVTSRAANVSFTFTNSFNQPDTNWFKVIPVSGPVAHADGSFTTIGLPIRVTPNSSGIAVTNIAQNNYLVTNAFLGQGYYIRVPQDSGPTVYPSGQLLISGGNVFVTVGITNGTISSLTFEILTNVLGFTPLATTNLPALTNNFIAPIDFTNLFNALILAPTNGFTSIVYSNPAAFTTPAGVTNLFNGLIVAPTNGFTSIVYSNPAAFTTPVTVTNITQALLMLATNGHIRLQDATNVFNGLITGITNVYGTIAYSNASAYTTIALLNSTSNALDTMIGNAGISAATATNIASAATNGLISLRDATNVANAIAMLATNGIGTAAYSNAAAFYLASNPNNYFSGPQVTNLSGIYSNSLNTAINSSSNLLNGIVAANYATITNASHVGSLSISPAGSPSTIQQITPTSANVMNLGPVGGPFMNLVGGSNLLSSFFTGFFIGNGAGLTNVGGTTNITGPGLFIITNVATAVLNNTTSSIVSMSTNLGTAVAGQQGTNAANNQITNLVGGILTASNYQAAINTSSNGGFNAGTNFGLTTFVLEQGGQATNLVVTNGPSWSGTNISIGPYLVFQQSTNLVHFNSSGSAGMTNGLYVWFPSIGGALPYYTNSNTGSWITNNGSVWQVFSPLAVQLFSSTRLDTNAWTLQSGTGAAASVWGAYEYGDGSFIVGIVTSTNISTNILNGAGGISTLGGHGTNTYITNLVVDWNSPNPGLDLAQNNGAALNFQAAAFGQANTNTASGFGSIVAGGATNKINAAGDSFIGAGIGNNLGGGFNNGDFLGAGISNTVGGIDRSFLGAGFKNSVNGGDSFIGAGTLNNIQSGIQYTSILGGASNTNGSSYATVLGGTNNQTGANPGGAVLAGFNNQITGVSASQNSGSVILGGNGNAITGTSSYSAPWSMAAGRNITITNGFDFVWSDGTPANTITNSQVILEATNGVMVNTNNAGTNALEVLGNVDATSFTSANGKISVQTASFTSGSLLSKAIGTATNEFQSTNYLAFYNAGTSSVTNGLFEWQASQGQFSNRTTFAIITNNSGTFNLWSSQGGTILYSSATLINNSWTVNGGSAPGPGSVYGPQFDAGHTFFSGWLNSTNLNWLITNLASVIFRTGLVTTNPVFVNPTIVSNQVSVWHPATQTTTYFNQITNARAVALPGDWISVGPGTYQENALLTNGVNYFFSPGAFVFWTPPTTNGAGDYWGFFDDRPTGPTTNVIIANGATFYWQGNTNQVTNTAAGAATGIATQGYATYGSLGPVVITNALSCITLSCHQIEASSWTEPLCACVSAINGTITVNVDAMFDPAQSVAIGRGTNYSFPVGNGHLNKTSSAMGVFWQNGVQHINCLSNMCGLSGSRANNYAMWGIGVTTSDVDDYYYTGDFIGGKIYVDTLTTNSVSWIHGKRQELQTSDVTTGNPLSMFGSQKTYVVMDKMESAPPANGIATIDTSANAGTSNTLAWINVQKFVGSNVWFNCVGNSNGIFANIDQLEDLSGGSCTNGVPPQFLFVLAQPDKASHFYQPVAIQTNTVIPAPTVGAGIFNTSNYDLYWITPTKTNLVVLGH